jgi:PAS domain S-box-containing protein
MSDSCVWHNRIKELEELLEHAERKSDILTNLLKEASAEFKQALEKVSTSEANFRAIFENAPVPIYIIDTDSHHILDCNPFTLQWLGYQRSELLFMKVEDILEPDIDGIPKNIQKALEEGRVHIQERRFIRKDGYLLDAEITGTLIQFQGKKCFVALVWDVTQRKQIEELQRYKELFANVSDPVFINDTSGKFLEVNGVACSCFGFARDDLLRKKLADLVSPQHKARLLAVADRLQKERALQFELEMQTKYGLSIPFEINSSIIHFKGLPAVLSVARNLSMRKKMEETLVKTERLMAVGEMASGVAHNFNNLLQMIMGGGEAAIAKLHSGRIRECHEAIQNILTACRRGTGIVRRIKDFTLSKTDDINEAKVFDLEEIITEAVELTKPMLDDIQICPYCGGPHRYKLNFLYARQCYIKGKPSELYEVLVNLIRNALEAMPHGGILTFATQVRENKVFFSISDTGHGIPEENFHRIFEPFFTTKGSKSSGLGLASSYGIVKKHDGEIFVQSVPGEGTTFTLVFPLAVQLETEESQPDELRRFNKIRFLLIDDEVNILRAMEMFFEDSPVEILTAETALEGLKTLENDRFNVILCDFGLDEMNGLEMGKAVKDYCARSGIPKIPFMLYTGLDKNLDQNVLNECGIDRVVNKPIRCEDLLRIIESVVADQPVQKTTFA